MRLHYYYIILVVLMALMNLTQDIGDLVLKLLHTTIHTVSYLMDK